MKEIRNKTALPVRVPLPGGKVLHLGPQKVAQIADGAVEHKAVLRLVKAGTIEILGDGNRAEAAEGPAPVAEQTHGQAKSGFRRGQSER